MRPASAKAKGRRLQQQLRDDVLHAFGGGLAPDDVRSTSMGAGGEDLLLSAVARAKLRHLSIEAKNTERLALWTALAQAARNAPAGCTPCVVVKKNRVAPQAVVPWAWLLETLVAADEGDEVVDAAQALLALGEAATTTCDGPPSW